MKPENEKCLCALISKIENEYGRYIGEKSLTLLAYFLHGYRYRFFEEEQYLFTFQTEFQSYIEKKYPQKGGYAWNELICGDLSEDKAFDAFYRFFQLFLQETEYGNVIRRFSDRQENPDPIRGRFSD